jgi:CxxC-x17-CxxC domain-containing protein
LRNKEYVLRNKQLSKEEYEKQLAKILEKLFEDPDWMDTERRKIRDNAIHRDTLIINGENVSGNYIRNCKNTHNAFDAENLEDCKFVNYALDAKDCYDISCVGFRCEKLYEVISVAFVYNGYFCNGVFPAAHDLQYCIASWNGHNLFGCIAIHGHQSHCILNKQYSEKEYNNMVPKIIDYMKKTSEYGEFFPPSLSPFEYNRSNANDYMPLTKEEAQRRRLKWFDEVEEIAKQSEGAEICTDCKKSYRLIDQEQKFYSEMMVPKPKFCWPCRLKKLISSRRPKKLFEDVCKKCSKPIKTPISPSLSKQVYCEKCYLEAVY